MNVNRNVYKTRMAACAYKRTVVAAIRSLIAGRCDVAKTVQPPSVAEGWDEYRTKLLRS